MGKTRDIFKKTVDSKGTFHARMGMLKNRDGKDLKAAEEIKERQQEYTELYKKGLNAWITMIVWSVTYSQKSWSVKSNGPQEASL